MGENGFGAVGRSRFISRRATWCQRAHVIGRRPPARKVKKESGTCRIEFKIFPFLTYLNILFLFSISLSLSTLLSTPLLPIYIIHAVGYLSYRYCTSSSSVSPREQVKSYLPTSPLVPSSYRRELRYNEEFAA